MNNLIPQQIKLTLDKIKSLFIRKDPEQLYFETVRNKQAQRKNKGITKALMAFSSHVQKQGPPKPQPVLLNVVANRKVYAFSNFNEEEYDENSNFPHNQSFQKEKPVNTSEVRDQRVRKLKKKIVIQQFKNKRKSGGGFGYGFQEGTENQNDNSTILNYQQQIDDLLSQKQGIDFKNKKQKKRMKQQNKYFRNDQPRELTFNKEPIRIRQHSFTSSKSHLDNVQHRVFSTEYQSFHSLSQQKHYEKQKPAKGRSKMSLKQVISKVKYTAKIQTNERKTEKLLWHHGIKSDLHPKPIEIKRPHFLDLDMNDNDK